MAIQARRRAWSSANLPRWAALAPAAALAALTAATGRPFVLINTTPSEPPGLYMASLAKPTVGRIIAFAAPPPAFPYADERLGYLRRTPILKVIAAGPGDRVCALGGRLQINGRDRAAVAAADSRGRPLPQWRGCRALAAGELFVFSDRVANSFDSRYFGPVPTRSVLGVFRRVPTEPETR